MSDFTEEIMKKIKFLRKNIKNDFINAKGNEIHKSETAKEDP